MFQADIANPASFTDDTSLPFAPFVSIYAQVVAEGCELGWFHLLRDLCGSAADREFKRAAIEMFFSQSIPVQLNLLRSIGYQVRIHITDPRPHIAEIGGFLREVLPKGANLITFIKKLEAATAHLAAVRDLLNDYVAKTLLRHAPAQYYLMAHRALEYASERTRTPFDLLMPQPLMELDSANSEHIQAADIAAGIARELWFRWSLVQVVRHFCYVTYNSERLSVDKAASIQRLIEEEL